MTEEERKSRQAEIPTQEFSLEEVEEALKERSSEAPTEKTTKPPSS